MEGVGRCWTVLEGVIDEGVFWSLSRINYEVLKRQKMQSGL